MSAKLGPVFLERRTYRRRRAADAARLLPFLGVVLIGVPLLWGDESAEMAKTTRVMLYLFLVWVLLAGLSAIISRNLDKGEDDAPPGEMPTRDDM
ncbi:hypothetical protein KPG71_05390 [Roseovarius sp. PS-C2]|uniref:hypothetical protein n=1 Tax=Roseovarius sp. PS-C2 TaxID=2820814 RepID=UPI001C0BFAF1|nr:hypothetical protein [Roseovarius sp. PS-C2]MBU3259444.1 hypothetical protein [Roseovarius sp. PS-C2]